MLTTRALFLLLSLAVLLLAASAQAAKVDNSAYAELLAKYNKAGMVDYKGMQAEKAKLDGYLKTLAGINPDELPRNDQYAYYLNLYNAATLQLILDHYPVKSIKDITFRSFSNPTGNRWKHEFIELKGEKVSLDNVEHDILRPVFKDPRVHFGVNCASIGCPILHTEPFEGATLEETLDAQVRWHMKHQGYVKLEGRNLHLSKIFDWFGGDWGDDQDKIAFVKRYAPEALRERLEDKGDRIRVKYLDYDWSLNEAK